MESKCCSSVQCYASRGRYTDNRKNKITTIALKVRNTVPPWKLRLVRMTVMCNTSIKLNLSPAFSCSVNALQPPAVLTAVNQSVLTKNGWIILTINLQNIILEQNSNLSFTQSVFRRQDKVSLIPPEMCLLNACNKQRVECRIEAVCRSMWRRLTLK